MGREVKRVPLDFDWELNEVWHGFLSPDKFREDKCPDCKNGYSPYAQRMFDRWYGYIPFHPSETGCEPLTPDTPAVRARAERNVARSPEYYGSGEYAIEREARRLAHIQNACWMYHLAQEDVDALIAADRLWDFTRTCTAEDGWKIIEPPPTVTAAQVNEWSLQGFGHDSINASVAVRAACERAGEPEGCGTCGGHSTLERYEGQRAEAEAWEPTPPPEGDGWQLWETVSEGSPVSPVFETAGELAAWMVGSGQASTPEGARKFVEAAWAPSFVGSSAGLQSGVDFMGSVADE